MFVTVRSVFVTDLRLYDKGGVFESCCVVNHLNHQWKWIFNVGEWFFFQTTCSASRCTHSHCPFSSLITSALLLLSLRFSSLITSSLLSSSLLLFSLRFSSRVTRSTLMSMKLTREHFLDRSLPIDELMNFICRTGDGYGSLPPRL